MQVRRCAHLFVELDDQPRFDFSTLLSGGDGLNRTPRWLVYAPHLDEPVPVDSAQLALLEQLSAGEPGDWQALCERHGAASLQALLDAGLLIGDQDGQAALRERDAVLRDVAWWPLAAIAHAHGRWQDVDIQSRNEQGIMLSSQQMVDAFGHSPEPEYLRNAGTVPVALPKPEKSALDDLLALRKTCRNFDSDAAVSQRDLTIMLHRVWGAIGTLELAPGAIAVKKNSPAGGGLHAVEAYVLVQRVEGLAPGLYHYLSLQHALEPMQAMDAAEATTLAHRFVAGQNWFNNVPVMVIMTARFDRLFWKYRRHTKAWRVVHLDVGHLSQTMYLSAADLGLGAFVTAAINDRAIEQALALTPMREGAIALVGFGPRAAETTTMELDNLTPTAAIR
jgi:putative peptide maturation dehydrogenase